MYYYKTNIPPYVHRAKAEVFSSSFTNELTEPFTHNVSSAIIPYSGFYETSFVNCQVYKNYELYYSGNYQLHNLLNAGDIINFYKDKPGLPAWFSIAHIKYETKYYIYDKNHVLVKELLNENETIAEVNNLNFHEQMENLVK